MERNVVIKRDPMGRWYFDLGRRTFYFWDKAHAEKALEILKKSL